MDTPKCPYCGHTMTATDSFFDQYSGSYSTFAKCWRCGSQGPLVRSTTAAGAQGRAMKHALKRPEQKPLRWEQLETLPIVWLEDKDVRAVIPAFPCPVNDRSAFCFLTQKQDNAMLGTAEKIDYGKRWRAWAAQPTQEERSAAKWM